MDGVAVFRIKPAISLTWGETVANGHQQEVSYTLYLFNVFNKSKLLLRLLSKSTTLMNLNCQSIMHSVLKYLRLFENATKI